MFRGLLAKFIMIAMPVFLVINAGFLTAYGTYRLDALKSDLAADTASLAYRLSKGITRPLVQDDLQTVNSVLATLVGNRSIQCATVTDKHQSVITTWPFANCEATSSTTGKVDIKLKHRRKPIGALAVSYNEDWSREALQKELGYIGIALLFASGMAFLACLVAHRVTIGRPLERLIEAIDKRIKAGGHDVVQWQSRDELGKVISVYNDMTVIEQKRLLELTSTAEALTLEVEERKAKEQALQAAHAQLLQASKMEAIGSLAAGVAHEINTPLQYMSTNLLYLQEGFDEIDQFFALIDEADPTKDVDLKSAMEEHDIKFLREEYPIALKQAQTGIEQISSIVGAVKLFSDADQGIHEPIDLSNVVRNAVELSQSEWKPVAEVQYDFADGLPAVQGNAAALGQAVLNLIRNSVQAINERTDGQHGAINLRVIETGGNVGFQITDSGVGIPEENLNRVFDLFFTTKPPGEGTGQGLAVAHTIVAREHGGALTVTSAPGEGATFEMALPIAA